MLTVLIYINKFTLNHLFILYLIAPSLLCAFLTHKISSDLSKINDNTSLDIFQCHNNIKTDWDEVTEVKQPALMAGFHLWQLRTEEGKRMSNDLFFSWVTGSCWTMTISSANFLCLNQSSTLSFSFKCDVFHQSTLSETVRKRKPWLKTQHLFFTH